MAHIDRHDPEILAAGLPPQPTRLGGADRRENGLLYDPDVNAEKIDEAIEKFVLGAAFSGLRFGYLWSTGTGPGDSDARGFGKSVLMQYLAWRLNQDYGRSAYLNRGWVLACNLAADISAWTPSAGPARPTRSTPSQKPCGTGCCTCPRN